LIARVPVHRNISDTVNEVIGGGAGIGEDGEQGMKKSRLGNH
jgi:hypothetical protein